MGVRGVTPRGGKRSDRAYALSIHGLCAVVLTRRPGKDSASAGAELVRRIARQAAFSRVHQNSVPSVQMQCRMTAILRAIAMRAFLPPIRFAKRMSQAFKRREPLNPGQQHVGCFVEAGAGEGVTAFRDAPLPVCLAGLIACRRQAEIRADVACVLEAARVINSG